jgi:Carbohydrate esterase 2 N-terminal/GDSL-like Lipase/Acylhydrolase family
MKQICFLFGLSFCLSTIMAQAQTNFIPHNHPSIFYQGRIMHKKDVSVLTWPGSSATIVFNGTSMSATLKDNDTANYYNVIVDGEVIKRIHTDTIKQSYLLVSGLPKGKHTLQLFKRTEWEMGKTSFFGFETDKQTQILPRLNTLKRKIEFYGNSITCGYANEDSSGQDSWHGYFENNYLTYAAITARHFNAQYSNVSKSGIGVLVSWGPMIMSEMYDRMDAKDSVAKWNFKNYTPDVVVINLFQNDSWLTKMPDHEQFKRRFDTKAPTADEIVAAYKNFVKTIRSKYPKAHIICALGNMDASKEGAPWPGYIERAVAELNDSKLYSHVFKYKNTPGHPNIAEQKAMADSLIAFIEQKIRW